jgi:hypothetical protein
MIVDAHGWVADVEEEVRAGEVAQRPRATGVRGGGDVVRGAPLQARAGPAGDEVGDKLLRRSKGAEGLVGARRSGLTPAAVLEEACKGRGGVGGWG